MVEEIINVKNENSYLIKELMTHLDAFFGTSSFSVGDNSSSKNYRGFSIEIKTGGANSEYTIIFRDYDKNRKEKLEYIATNERSNFSDVEKIAKEIKMEFMETQSW